jgi:virginiamycin B lyase
VGVSGQQRWLAPGERALVTDARVHAFPLPSAGSGPTTIALAADGTVWFTEGSGNRIGRMAPDGTALREFLLPYPNSSPRIISLGSDGNMWFSEHTGNRMGRITPAGVVTEFPLGAGNSGATGLTAGSDRQPPERIGTRLWFAMSAANKLGYFEFR